MHAWESDGVLAQRAVQDTDVPTTEHPLASRLGRRVEGVLQPSGPTDEDAALTLAR